MKNKFFVILAIIALAGFVVTLDYGDVWAQQEGPPEPFDEAKHIIRVEYSTDSLGPGLTPDVDENGAADPRQVLYTLPPDALGFPPPGDTYDFCDSIDVDAIANRGDYLFWNLATEPPNHPWNTANLLVSFEYDPDLAGGVVGDNIAVYSEDILGNTSPRWIHNLLPPPPKPPNLDRDGKTLNDTLELDGLELWGPPGADDADYYSLIGDPIPDGGVPAVKYSVFCINPPDTHVQIPYIPHSVIVAAVTSAALDTVPGEGHYEGPEELVDLDALMVWDMPVVGTWGADDAIIFSIRAAGNWDGGEIVVLEFGAAPRFLNHGGHAWNTAFGVSGAFNLAVATEEVDAIEAYPYLSSIPPGTPTLTEWGLIVLVALLIASTVFVILKRRKAVVRA